MLLGSPSWVRFKGKSVGTVVLLVLLLTLGAFLLHLIYCEGPTLYSAWCCHLQAERGASFYKHLVTTEPANQSGCPMVAALSLGSRADSFMESLQFLVAKWFCLKQTTLYRAEKAHSFNAFLVTLSQRKQ